jgi:FAD/FMN-containing dehydrogenase
MSTTVPRQIDDGALETFTAGFSGEVVLPSDSTYDETRQVWNATIDRRPSAIARCGGVADVIATVNFAREQGLPLAVRGGGHNIAGKALGDDCLVADLSGMSAVRVNEQARTARVEGGALLADVDHETQAFGLATPFGINSTTGVAGLTLGGGFGWLTRRYGMTVDNLQSVDIVTANGELLHASADEHPDLFWAVRGGSGNFGVVTSFEFDLHDVGPEVLCGPLVYRHKDAVEVMQHIREFNADAPDESAVWMVLRKAPPLPVIPEAFHGTDVLIVVPFYAGDIDEGERLFEQLRAFGEPIADGVAPHPYAGFQQAFDPLIEPGARNYWKTHNFKSLSDEAIESLVEMAGRVPSPHTELFLAQLGGAMARVDSETTAYPHRDTQYVMNVHARWTDETRDDDCIEWAREVYNALEPNASGGGYINFLSEGDEDAEVAYAENYDRLVEVKARYDPKNLFSVNQDVAPADV